MRPSDCTSHCRQCHQDDTRSLGHNGPELVSKALDAWAYRNRVRLEFSRPGKPTDNAFESFNGHFRAECLDHHWFASLEEARQTIEAWRAEDQHGGPGEGVPE